MIPTSFEATARQTIAREPIAWQAIACGIKLW
jgi:hypothetical protein